MSVNHDVYIVIEVEPHVNIILEYSDYNAKYNNTFIKTYHMHFFLRFLRDKLFFKRVRKLGTLITNNILALRNVSLV